LPATREESIITGQLPPKYGTITSQKTRTSIRHYFLPVGGSQDENIRRKSKNRAGIFTIKWKKGLKLLNLNNEGADESESTDKMLTP